MNGGLHSDDTSPWRGKLTEHPTPEQAATERELGTFEDWQRWAEALTEDALPDILSGLVVRGPDRTTIDAEELTRRMSWVINLEMAVSKARRALVEIEALLAYEDVQGMSTDLFKDEQGQIR